jgi:glycosyltransferase involved in cell wall biosynthesis
MGKRIKLGIVYSYDENWIGGTYYYQNLIRSLKLLSDEKRPHLIIIGNKQSFETVAKLKYPYLSAYLFPSDENVIYTNLIDRIKNYLSSFLTKSKKNNSQPEIDVLFHPTEIAAPIPVEKHLYWIPDFQEVYLPHLFSKDYIEFRKNLQLDLLTENHHVVFSSIDAMTDFKKLYPNAPTNCYIVNFAVFHPDFSKVSLSSLREKFKISDRKYFYVPNQFWKHKNHIIVLKAVQKVKNEYDNNFELLFSGKESDFRNPEYVADLKHYVNQNELSEIVRFLGFIDRAEQLCLMNNAVAIIQPSLFEGWSTVVEDVKAISQNIIVSDLNVHKDQLGDAAYYFNPHNEDELAEIMSLFLKKPMQRPLFDYGNRLEKFGSDFMSVVESIMQD